MSSASSACIMRRCAGTRSSGCRAWRLEFQGRCTESRATYAASASLQSSTAHNDACSERTPEIAEKLQKTGQMAGFAISWFPDSLRGEYRHVYRANRIEGDGGGA